MSFLTMARTVYGEARGETWEGKVAVAWVIKNRAKKGGWWGDTIDAVCLFPKQFSCWDDHNRLVMMTATEDDPAFLACLDAATAVLTGRIQDPTSGSCHYHASDIHPDWAEGHTSVATIGRHCFYRDIP